MCSGLILVPDLDSDSELKMPLFPPSKTDKSNGWNGVRRGCGELGWGSESQKND